MFDTFFDVTLFEALLAGAMVAAIAFLAGLLAGAALIGSERA